MGPGPAALSRRRTGHAVARDVLAGVTVALVLVPQALAYASVAGMPPVSGLYAAALPLLAASVCASSPYLQTGPVAVTSLLTLGALAGQAPVGSQEYAELGMLLALVVGTVRLALGLLRGGLVAHLMSEPMLMGFVPAGALVIIATQLPAALGAPVEGGVLEAAAHAAVSPAGWSVTAIALAACALAIVIGGRRLHRLFPGVLVALVVGVALGAAGAGATVGAIPAGLPPLSLDLPWGELPSLLAPGVLIAVIGFAEPAAIARTYAIRERRPWSADREFVSQGAANVVAGLSGGYPVGGSLSRTALNHAAGAATRLSGAITGLVVLSLLPLAGVLETLPRAVLAAIVISAVLGLLRPGRVLALWTVSRPQALIAWTTFVLTLALAPHVERAVIAGVALSLLVHLVRELSLRVEPACDDGVLDVRLAGVLWFATAPRLPERIVDVLERHPDATDLRLDLSGLGRIDLTGVMTLDRLAEDARASGLTVCVRGVPHAARGLLDRFDERRERLV